MSDVDRRDLLGARRLSRREEIFWYLVAGVSYIIAATFEKGLLNWSLKTWAYAATRSGASTSTPRPTTAASAW